MFNTTMTVIMDQESFALDGSRRNSMTDISGIIQIHSDSHCFTPPTSIQIQLVGKEHIGYTCQVIVNDTYMISSNSTKWNIFKSTCSSKSNIPSMRLHCLPFSLCVPSDIPSSFQFQHQLEDGKAMLCKIHYSLEIKASSIEKFISKTIKFHRSSVLTSKRLLSERKEALRRVYWGVTKQSKQGWRYEIEFPNVFDLSNLQTDHISIRLRSIHGDRKELNNECCLIGCQIIQSIHSESYQNYVQVLATTTKLITNPNKSWSQPSQIEFDLENSVLPTVKNVRLGVDHFIRITANLCSGAGEVDTCTLDLQFPVVFNGCTTDNQVLIQNASFRSLQIVSPNYSSSSSMSSLSSFDEAIDESIIMNIASSPKPIRDYLHSYPLEI